MNTKNRLKRILATLTVLIAFAAVSFAQGTFQVASLFKDGMVLQREMDVPIWGKAPVGTTITATFAGQSKTTTAQADGKWLLTLAPLKASLTPRRLELRAAFNQKEDKIKIDDVVVGEVWICAGQSNMKWEANRIPEIKALKASAKNIRTFAVKRTVAFTEQDTCTGTWQAGNPSSAVAFSFAYFLEKAVEMPIGIILNPWGSSSLEAWMPRDMTQSLPHFKKVMAAFDADTASKSKIQRILNEKKRRKSKDDIFLRRQPNILYNAMMKPLAPFACRGIVWYQGERNSSSFYDGTAEPMSVQTCGMLNYGDAFKKWMKRYRKEWQKDDLHFMVVMLPGFAKKILKAADHPDTTSWAWMRESQMKALELPHTSVLNIIDLGEAKNIHPADKLPVGKRLALLAQKDIHHMQVSARGPIMTQVKRKKNTLIVHFKHAQGLKTKDGKAPSSFYVARKKGEWFPAVANIVGETVELTCPELKKPKYVRYAFAGKPKVNLVNSAELPAFPFRTDAFKP